MDENEGDKGKKTNASPEHKPKDAVAGDVAPQGSVGRPPASPSAPGLGTSPKGQRLDGSLPPQPPSQGQDQQPEKDGRDVFFETDDPDVNAHAQKTDRMIGKDSPDHPDNKTEAAKEGPRISQSDYAKAFRQARDNTQGLQKGKDQDLE